MEAMAMIRQAFEEESMSRTLVFEWHVRFRQNEKGEASEGLGQERAHNFL
jgi:hypothetical protein